MRFFAWVEANEGWVWLYIVIPGVIYTLPGTATTLLTIPYYITLYLLGVIARRPLEVDR